MSHRNRPSPLYPCLLGGLLALLTLTACVQSESVTTAGKPSSPLQLRLQPVEEATPGRDVTFEAELLTTISLEQVVLEITLPTNIPLLSGLIRWQGPLLSGQPQRIAFSIHIPAEGTHRIKATAFVPDNNGHISTEAVFIVGAQKPETATGIDRSQRPAHPTRDGRPVLEYEIR